MDAYCFFGPAAVRDPKPLDTCSVNHAGYPVLPMMYGDSFDADSQSLAYRTCP
jgi:hypothetical protein